MEHNIAENVVRISCTQICSTYNSYIINGEKTAIIDVIQPSGDEESEKIKKAEYLVFTHTEPARAKLLEEILDANKDAVVVGTTATVRNYKEILKRDFNELVIKNGGELDLGGTVLEFYVAPNLNQPDTMLVFEKQSRTLFSGNLFSSYDTDNGVEWFYSEKLSMYEGYVLSAQKIVKELEPTLVCPYIGTEYHGAEEYEYDIPERADKTAAVYYSSMYGYTREMAKVMADALIECGVEVVVFDADRDDWEDMCSALDSDILMFGSSTVHRNAAKSIWRLISEINAVSAPEKTAVVFGSYGWSGEACKIMEKLLKSLKVKVYGAPQTAVYKPTEEKLAEICEFVRELADKI